MGIAKGEIGTAYLRAFIVLHIHNFSGIVLSNPNIAKANPIFKGILELQYWGSLCFVLFFLISCLENVRQFFHDKKSFSLFSLFLICLALGLCKLFFTVGFISLEGLCFAGMAFIASTIFIEVTCIFRPEEGAFKPLLGKPGLAIGGFSFFLFFVILSWKIWINSFS